jgi:hypothetical protein
MRLSKDQNNKGSRERMLGLRKSCMEVLDEHEFSSRSVNHTYSIHVATLALGLRPRQRGCKVAG